MLKKKKKSILRKILKKFSGIAPKNFNYRKYENLRKLKNMSKSMLFRGKPMPAWLLIKGIDKRHKKELREEEEALGISALVKRKEKKKYI